MRKVEIRLTDTDARKLSLIASKYYRETVTVESEMFDAFIDDLLRDMVVKEELR